MNGQGPIARRIEPQCGAGSRESRKTRILIIHSSDELYGSDRVLLEVVSALKEIVDIEVWLPQDVRDGECLLSRELALRGVATRHERLPILRRKLMNPRGMLSVFRNFFSCFLTLRKQRADIVYLMTSACLPVAPMARVLGFDEVLVHVQEIWSGRDTQGLRFLSRFTTKRIAISRTVAQAAQPDRESRRSIQVVPNAVAKPQMDEFVNEGNDGAGPTYVMASRWNPGKGHGTLLRAWEEAGCPGTLQILGSRPEHGNGVDVVGLVEELISSPDSVQVVGHVPDISPYIFAADAVIVPSDGDEGFGLVVIEAFALGKPAIVSNAGGPAEIVTHAMDGYVFERGSATALGELFKGLDRGQLAQAGEHASRTYSREYSIDRFTGEMRRVVLGMAAT